MPARALPVFTRPQVESHNSEKSLFVTIGRRVYDVTEFAGDHPGGADLILEYAGRDVDEILKDGLSHVHSEAAYEVLEDSLVGFLESGSSDDDGASATTQSPAEDGSSVTSTGSADGVYVHPRTGMSCEEDLSRETDLAADFRRHKFLDLGKPMFPQIWYGGFTKQFYLDQVHRPRHYKGGQSAPLFGNFLEPLSKTPWWVVPTLWLPFVAYGLRVASRGFGGYLAPSAYWMFGLCFWTVIEYFLHRFLFHLDGYLPDNRVGITAHFLLHGIHHYLPMDKYRLVMPPTLFAVMAFPFWFVAHALVFWNWHGAVAAYSGGVFGYVCYDLTHYFLHHRNLPAWYRELKKYHLQHHFLDYENGFGVTSRFWDRVFGTELQPQLIKTS